MRGRRRFEFTCALFALFFSVVATPSGALSPVPPSAGLGIQHAALHALENTLREGALYAETPVKDRFFTKDQMMGVMAALLARNARPDKAAFWEQRARDLWGDAESAFVASSYATTVPAPADIVCIDLVTNSWAVRAAQALVDARISVQPDPTERLLRLRGMLGDFLTSTSSEGKPLCPGGSTSVPIHQRPMLYLALLETRTTGGTDLDMRLQTAIRDTITSSYDDAFALPDDLYLAVLNAQMLAVMTEASRVFPDTVFVDVRDGLTAWLQTETIGGGASTPEVRNVLRKGDAFEHQAGPSIDGQIWVAYALSNVATQRPDLVDEAVVDLLLRTYVDLFWNATAAGFANEATAVYADYNLLPAILSRAQALSVVAVDPSTLAFVVPAIGEFTYPEPKVGEVGPYIVNQWTVRINLPSGPSGPSPVLVPATDIAALNFTSQGPPFYPEPRLVRSGATGLSEVPVSSLADDPNLLLFLPPATAGSASYRLDAYVPARPVFSDFGATIRVAIDNYADQALVVGALQVELDATRLLVRTATLDNVPLEGLEVIETVITEQLREPHMRLIFTDVELPPGRSELVIGYQDITRPDVATPSLSRDLNGTDVIRADGDNPIQVLQGETAFVRATVRDNAALRSVQLRYRMLDQSLDLKMSPVPGQADVYAVQLPTESMPTGEALIQVIAVDAAGTGNLNESAEVRIDLRDPLLAGSIVLFVFSGTLFLASLVIWVKVRRKALR